MSSYFLLIVLILAISFLDLDTLYLYKTGLVQLDGLAPPGVYSSVYA